MDRDDILPFRITLAEGERDRLGSMRLLPGMPVECFVQTGDRVVLCYLTRPLVDRMMRPSARIDGRTRQDASRG
jgi:hypothetical protein